MFGMADKFLLFDGIGCRDQCLPIQSYRYTYRPDTGAVYGTLTQAYQSKVILGNLVVGSSSKVSLVGYDDKVTWEAYTNDTIAISMPPLPLDTELRWAWVFKFENVLPSK